jgi:hypothetical protein
MDLKRASDAFGMGLGIVTVIIGVVMLISALAH